MHVERLELTRDAFAWMFLVGSLAYRSKGSLVVGPTRGHSPYGVDTPASIVSPPQCARLQTRTSREAQSCQAVESIRSAKHEYQRSLQDAADMLSQVARVTRTCDMPEALCLVVSDDSRWAMCFVAPQSRSQPQSPRPAPDPPPRHYPFDAPPL